MSLASKVIESFSKSESIDWSKCTSGILKFAAALGLGPLYKPAPKHYEDCPSCHKKIAYYKEFGGDCDGGQDEILLYCPKCNQSFESKSQPLDNPKIADWKNGRPQLRNKDGKLVDYTDIKVGEINATK